MQENKYIRNMQTRKNSDNIYQKMKNYGKTNKNIKIVSKMTNILNSNVISKERRKFPFRLPLKQNISSDIITERNTRKQNIDIYGNFLKYYLPIEERILLQRPQVRIKMHSIISDNINKNTISSEKNNKQIKCKVHKLKPNTTKNNDHNIKKLNISKSFKKQKQNDKNRINYDIMKLNNKFNLSQMNNEQKNNETKFLNYYNILQEKSLKMLSNHLDNLIGNKSIPKSKFSQQISNNGSNNIISENIKNEKEMSNIYNFKIKPNNSNIYRKVIQRKKNYCYNNNKKVISDANLIDLDNKKYMNDVNKIDFFNDEKNILKNKLKKRRQKFICTRNNYENYNKFNISLKNYQSRHFKNNKNNNTVLMTSFSQNKGSNIINNINLNFPHELRGKKDILNIDNIQNNTLIFKNKKDKANTINFIEMIKLDYKKENPSSRKNHFTDLRYKKDNYYIGTPKLSNIHNNNKYDDISKSNFDNTFNLNHSLGNNEINFFGPKKNCITLYSNNTSEYNTVNTLNNSEKNIIKFPSRKEPDNCNIKFKNNTIIKKIPFQKIKLPQKKIYIKDDFLISKRTTTSNSKNKRLRNVVTSIEYRNKNNKKSNNCFKDKNIILSEIDQNGKINIRVREMKNSIEKIIRENSFNKGKNETCLPSPIKANNILTYVKKNQGTHIRKIKKHDTVNNIDSYPPPIPFQ